MFWLGKNLKYDGAIFPIDSDVFQVGPDPDELLIAREKQ